MRFVPSGFFFFFLGLITASSITFDENSSKVRKLLLENLKGFFDEIKPFTTSQLLVKFKSMDRSKKCEEKKASSLKLDNDNFDFFPILLFEFLDFKDLLSLKLVNYKLYTDVQKIILLKRQLIKRVLVFEDSWMSDLINDYLRNNLSAFHNINFNGVNESEFNLYDQLEMETLQFQVSRDENEESTPIISREIIFYILSFLREILYGSNTHLPNTFSEWQITFLRNLKHHKNSFPETLNFYLNDLVGMSSLYSSIKDELKTGVDILINGDQNEIDGLFDWDSLFISQKYPGLLITPFIERIFPKFTRELDFFFACNFMMDTNSFSPEFWSFVSKKNLVLENHFNERSRRDCYAWNKKLILKFFGDKSPALSYLLTRSSADPFDLDFFMSMNGDMTILMTEFFNSNSFSLMEIEIFSQIIGAGYLPTELVGMVQDKLIKHFQSNFMNNNDDDF